jgi:ATP-dependent DNA helicase RecG
VNLDADNIGHQGDLASGGGLDAPEISTGVALLTGSMKAAGTRAALADIASGAAGIIVGTHSLLSGRVIYNDIGLVVVDEQHRFGVEQRSVLTTGEGARPHELVLTATPIPRTVAMTVFGDLEVSSLRELPTGRADVQTTVVDLPAHGSWLTRAWQRIREECDAGNISDSIVNEGHPLIHGEDAVLRGVHGHSDDDLVDEFGRSGHDVNVTEGDGVE